MVYCVVVFGALDCFFGDWFLGGALAFEGGCVRLFVVGGCCGCACRAGRRVDVLLCERAHGVYYWCVRRS